MNVVPFLNPIAQGARVRFARRAATFTLALGVPLALALPTATVASAAPAVASAPSLTYAVSARWITLPGDPGLTLSITPTGVAQTLGFPAATGVWNNALNMAGTMPFSPAVYNSLFEQLECHMLGYFKTPYHLDTWRPSVSWAAEIRDKCNPLPGESD
jgi:uncharacterized protein DUF2599